MPETLLPCQDALSPVARWFRLTSGFGGSTGSPDDQQTVQPYADRCGNQAAADVALSATAVRPPGTWRYSVEALHPICRATSEAVMVPDASIAFAALTLVASNAGGRPPTRPRARLAASAVRVRSRRSSTSNCPRAAKMWRISRPVALVVSMFSCSDRRPMPRTRQGVHRGQKLAHGSRQSVEPTDDQHITLAGELQDGGKLRAIGTGAAHRLLEHPFAPSSMESVVLTVSGLEIGRDTRIADQHGSLPELVQPPCNRDEGFGNEFWDAAWPLSRRNRN